jgi:hypothetical protein
LGNKGDKPMRERTERELSGIEVRVLDFSNLEADAAKMYGESHPELNNIETRVHHKWGYVETPKGFFVLNNEGIVFTDPLSDDDPIHLDIHGEWDGEEEGHRSCSFLPILVATFGKSDLDKYHSDSKVDLAEFIRTFGSRLESNYKECRDFLKQKLGKEFEVLYEVS